VPREGHTRVGACAPTSAPKTLRSKEFGGARALALISPLALETSLSRISLCSLWTTGPDPTVDGLVRILATRPGGTESFDRLCRPESSAAADRFGIAEPDLAASPTLAELWPELENFLGSGPVFVPDLAEFETWRAHAVGRRDPFARSAVAIGLGELRSLLLPGSPAPDLAPGLLPGDLGAIAGKIVELFGAQPAPAVELAAAGYGRALEDLTISAPDAASRLRIALDLASVRRGRASPADLADRATPACDRESSAWLELDPVPADCAMPAPLPPEELEQLDAVFRTHLPASFAADPSDGKRSSYRRSQHDVARAVADALGSGDLLLVHAPTGTGKTLAYLVPALLWSRRRGTRVGVATYTRALQQQAIDREVPRALAALAAAGIDPLPRVSMLKGRENYLCWRALKLAVPEEDDGGDAWLAWTSLALFALRDAEADLDRFPARPPIPLESAEPWRRRLGDLQRAVRSRVACCVHEEDRRACGAEVARKRAERSHLVVTNHAFLLSRPEFFKHVVFDECEHLHDQAHSAWSHVVGFRQMRAMLGRLHAPGREHSGSVLDRMLRAVVEGAPFHRAVETSLAAWREAAGSLARLESSLGGFETWREEAVRTRSERETHSLLREFVEREEGAGVLDARRALGRDLDALDAAISEIAERLDSTPLRGVPSLRRGLDLARSELARLHETLEAWLPVAEGRPAYRASFFYDLEVDPRGERAIAARVLLPNEVLGRDYHPQLSTGIYVSATTWLRGSFESALGYLGLDRAASPAEDEDRPPRNVRTFRAPEVFDYSRVLVAVPRDAPSVSRDKDAYLEYVRRFVGHLGERTRGRMLVLFTNAQDARRVGEELAGFFRARSIGMWYQNMESATKEELSDLFRARIDSVLLGVDTFWFGADFPGETLEHVVIVRLPYGVPDRYHHAQCAALGTNEQWRRIYMPRALAKFRQGFGRLMRRESDRGCVFILDGRALEPKHRVFLRELPVGAEADDPAGDEEPLGARLVRGDTERCLREAFAHMGLLPELRRRGLETPLAGASREEVAGD